VQYPGHRYICNVLHNMFFQKWMQFKHESKDTAFDISEHIYVYTAMVNGAANDHN